MFMNDLLHHWSEHHVDGVKVYYKGKITPALSIIVCQKNMEKIADVLKSSQDFSSAVIDMPDRVIAYVDHIRSWPVFFALDEGKSFYVSNNARSVQDKAALSNIDEDAALEFVMSGYIAGDKTLYQGLKCLQPGEFLMWDKGKKELSVSRYYQYVPKYTDLKEHTAQDNMDQLGKILDDLTLKMIAYADGRPIWLPLSGGLDSRILLCKFHEHGYKNLHTFTYGPRFNFESKTAKKVAHKLGVPWMFVGPSKKDIRRYFASKERKDFWEHTDGLKAISSMREFSALMWLREHNHIPDDAILVNGQSGDYITGDHISKIWTQDGKFSFGDFVKTIVNKHYSLWMTLKTEDNIETLSRSIQSLCGNKIPEQSDGYEYAKYEEVWEYDARQICLVANGQRSYDIFGYDWELPLWEKVLVDFCETLPFEQKLGQRLYKDYLRRYNYKGLFPEKEPYIWRWALPMLWVIPAAQVIGRLKGKEAKVNFYAMMRYHGHYANQFYAFPWAVHKKTYDIARNVMALNVRHWAIENEGVIPQNLMDAMRVDVK